MSRLIGGVAVLTVPLTLLMLNVVLLASGPFVRWEYARPGFPAARDMTNEQRLELAVPSARFVVDNSAVESLTALRDPRGPLYTQDEIEHVLDVRRLVRRASTLALFGLVIMVVAALVWRDDPDKLKQLLHYVERGGWLTVALVVSVGIGIALAWPLVFVGFHKLFFKPGTWAFPMDSGLIRLYPECFWFDTALALAALTLVEGGVVAVLARALRGRVTGAAAAGGTASSDERSPGGDGG